MSPHPAEHIARAMMMANDDPNGKWDLSPNDCAAIQHVIDRMRTAEAAIAGHANAIRLARFEAFTEAIDEVKAEAEFRRSDVVSARTTWLRIEELRSAAKPRASQHKSPAPAGNDSGKGNG